MSYCKKIGFNMQRKIIRFEDYSFLSEKYGKYSAVLWNRLYPKEGRYWIRNTEKPINEIKFVD